jgi:integrase
MKKPKADKRYGVTIAPLNGLPGYKWRVTFPEGGKRVQKYFKIKSGEGGALEFAEEKREELKQEGRKHESISDDERRAVIEFRELVTELPDSMDTPSLRDAVALYRKTLKIRHKSKTISELIKGCLQSVVRRGAGAQHEKKVSSHLTRFESDYGDWLACDLSTEIIADWLDNLKMMTTAGKKTRRKVSAQTENHYRRALTLLFSHAEKTGAIEINPMTHLEVKKVKTSEIGILSPKEVAALLSHASDEVLPGLALGFFAGIRRAELGRLDWSEIDFEEGHIEIKAAKAKTASRRIIKLRDNLRAWLMPQRQHEGPVMPSEATWRAGVADAMSGAGIESWPHNAARHSFASYHLAAFQNAAALALEMGHSNTKMIFEHYRALVSTKLGEKYWSIAPAAEGKVVRMV